MTTPDRSIALICKDPETMPHHRRRLAGTESLGIFQRNMLPQAMEALTDQGYSNIIMDGYRMLKPGPRKMVEKLRNQGKLFYHVVNLATPYEVASQSWKDRELHATTQGHSNADKAIVRRNRFDEKHQRDLRDKQLQVFFDLADSVTLINRNTINNELRRLIAVPVYERNQL